MTRVFCDICGEQIYYGLNEPIYKINIGAVSGTVFEGEQSYNYQEVCSGCVKKIASYVKGMPRPYILPSEDVKV